MSSLDIELADDLTDNIEIVYLEDEELDNLENDQIPDIIGEDIDPPEDKSLVTFKGHTRSVFCVNFNSDNTLAISGGEDDAAFVWTVSNGEVLLDCTGHKDSVTAAEFSFDDKYVVTGDMSGLIQVWDVQSKLLIWCYEINEMEWLFWHRSAHVLLAGAQSGEIYMWQIPQGNCKVFPTSGSKCTCGVLLQNGTQLAAGYENGCVKLWDLKSTSVLHQFNSDGKSGAINNLMLSSDDKLLVACGLCIGALILKVVDCKLIATLHPDSEEIETAAFCDDPSLSVVATGCLKGDVCLWDISRESLRHKTNIGYSVTNMIWGPNSMLFVAAVDGIVYVYSGKNCELLATLTGHSSAILDMRLSKDSKLLISSSDDATAKVFELENCCSVNVY